jgi:hypothetical protein
MLSYQKAERTDKQLSILAKPPMHLERSRKTALAKGLLPRELEPSGRCLNQFSQASDFFFLSF